MNDFDLVDSDLDAVNEAALAVETPALQEEICGKCRGSGKFVSYSGRVCGDCFACKGRGKLFFKRSAEERAKCRQQAAARKQNNAAASWEAFNAAYPVEAAWISAKRSTFDFAASMHSAILRFGSLTDKQLATVQRCAQQANERKAAAVQREQNAVTVSIERIETAFATAKASGLKRLKLRLASFEFRPAPESGRNAGSIYVTQDGVYLGKVTQAKFIRSRDCRDEQEREIIAVCSDPAAAAVAYGKETGQCACCGRELTDPVSIARSIGPICAGKWGW